MANLISCLTQHDAMHHIGIRDAAKKYVANGIAEPQASIKAIEAALLDTKNEISRVSAEVLREWKTTLVPAVWNATKDPVRITLLESIGSNASPKTLWKYVPKDAQAKLIDAMMDDTIAPIAVVKEKVAGLRVGTTPNSTDPVTVKDGVVHIGKSEALDFDTGEPVRVPDGATDIQIKDALTKAGSLSKRMKFYGLEKTIDEQANQAATSKQNNLPQPTDTQARDQAQADLDAALADLGDIIIKASGARSIVPQDNAKLLPVLVRLFDAGFRLGYYKFKDLAKFALDKITASLGKDAADSITLDHLQGAYISMGQREGTDTKKTVVNIEDRVEIENHVAKAHNGAKEQNDVPSTNRSVESNSQDGNTQRAVGDAVQNERGTTASGDRQADLQTTGSEGRGEQGDTSLRTGSAVADSERSDQLLRGEIGTGQSEIGDARTDFGERSGDSGITGVPPETIPAKSVIESATTGTDELNQKIAQKKTSSTVKVADLENIRETLPALLKNQQEDVHTAEVRFAKPDGYGMLFTNGTGTGKTFVGLGVVKRFALQGKNNTLIVVPDAKIAEDWAQSGKLLGLNILPLPSTQDAGRGIVVTTYANLRENDSLAKRNWDLVISDEAHELMANEKAKETSTLQSLRAITNHPDGVYTRFEMIYRKIISRAEEDRVRLKSSHLNGSKDPLDIKALADQKESVKSFDKQLSDAQEKIREQVANAQGVSRTRAVFLSATPFAYEKNIQWAQGYLFEYPQVQDGGRDYNRPDGYQQYMIENFGYRMKSNKLTEPDAKVNRGLMQRQFNTRLKKEGVLSGRMLDVVPDYDRRFVLVDSAIGNKIDEAMDWLKDETAKADGENSGKPKDQQTNGMALLRDHLSKSFDYLARRYLLEGIKAKEAVSIVKSHMALGRKVVVFHDYKKGDSRNPFDIRANSIRFEGNEQSKTAAANQAIAAFRAKFPELVNGLNDLDSPIETFKRELPETLIVNGNEKRSDLLKRYKHFQDDSTGSLVMLVQSAKNKGWSGHDTTGKNQRVLINLGQPTAPTLAIQQEGRIYRTGQASNAIMRYLNTGTNWEKWAFATTIASRASTAENLGMGESSRALKDSFINAFEESDKYPAGHEGEGTGGKERDKAANNALSEFDRAKSYYFSQLKKNSKTKAQEGADYFATPEPLGMKMAQWLDTHAGDKTLEPSAGHGAIARFISDESERTVIEPSTTLRSRLALVMNPSEDRIIDGDFESLNITNKYDGIVMNPPFGVGGKTAIEHLAKAATHLRDGGRIVALIPSGGMADKRLEQWLYGEMEKPVKPLMTHPVYGEIYRGDTITSRAGFIPNSATGIIVDSVRDGSLATKVKRETGSYLTTLTNESITSVKPTGARTEKVKLTEDLHLIADIKLPSSTFERAGTSVSTHVIVLQKGDNNIQQRNIDLTDADDINDLFDKIEDVDFAKRDQVAQPKLDNRSAVLPRATPATGDTITLGNRDYPVEIYTTNAGKDIRGAWVESKDEALKYGATTFQKNRKWFVRERDFPKSDTAFSRGGTIWRSALADNVNEINAKAQSEEGWRLNILGLVNKGKVKADEVEWSGINEWLKLQTGKVTKEQVMDYLNGNGVQVQDVTLGDENNFSIKNYGTGFNLLTTGEQRDVLSEVGTKYSQYQLAGGENYREVLLTLPVKKNNDVAALQDFVIEMGAKYGAGKRNQWTQEEQEKHSALMKQGFNKIKNDSGYKSSHWDEPNVLAHIRLNDRTDAEGNRVLFVEEVQSDWGQDGKKKGFQKDASIIGSIEKVGDHPSGVGGRYLVLDKDGKAIKPSASAEHWGGTSEQDVKDKVAKSFASSTPNAPFVTHTDKWLTLALKRIVKLAVDEGYDKVAFINGEQSADRYDLSKQVESITATKYGMPSTGVVADIAVYGKDGSQIYNGSGDSQQKIADTIGKELSEKIFGQQDDVVKKYDGLELKVGGEGMKAFYDKIVPSAANSLLKKLGGGKMENISLTDDATPVAKKDRYTGKYYINENSPQFDTREDANAWAIKNLGTQPSFTITDKMREQAADGLPMFAKQAGAVIFDENTHSTIARVQAAVTELIGGRQLPNKLGRIVVATADEIKNTWQPLASKNSQLGAKGEAGRALAFFDTKTKTIYLISDHIPKGEETAIVAHELMHKHGQAALGEAGWNRLHSTIKTWADAKLGSDERRVYDYAAGKVKDVGERLSSQELFPYAVEAAIKMNIKPSMAAKRGTVAYWLESVKQNLKVVWGKITGNPSDFKAQDLVDLSFAIAQMENPESAKVIGDAQLGVGEKMDGGNVTVLSRKFIQTNTEAFKKWFGDSKVVDAEGKPLAMYHGTGDTRITEFKPQGESAEKALALFKEAVKNNTPFGYMNFRSGSFFSPHPAYAGNYTGENSGVMYPVYIKAENPIYIDQRTKKISLKTKGRTPDALILHDGGIINEVAVIDPTQIKSAIGNNGNFDPTNPDIRYSRGDEPGEDIDDAIKEKMIEAYNNSLDRTDLLPDGYSYDELNKSQVEDMYGDLDHLPKDLQAALGRGESIVQYGDENQTDWALKKAAPNYDEFVKESRIAENLPMPVTDIDEMIEGDTSAAAEALKVMAESLGYYEYSGRSNKYFTLAKDNEDAATKDEYPNIKVHVRVADHSRTARGSRPDRAEDININLAPQQGSGNEFHGADDFESAYRKLKSAKLNADGELMFGNDEASRFSRSGDLLTPYTEAEARAKQEREERLLKEEQRTVSKPEKKVTADQVDMFNNQETLFSRSSNVWSTPERNTFLGRDIDKFIYESQDSRVDLKRVQEAIEKSGKQIEEKYDARTAETLYMGRVAYRSQNFLDTEAKDLLKEMESRKIEMTELSDFLHARGAEERNKQIAKVNPDMPDGGAGKNSQGVLMTTQAAKDYLASVRPAKRLALGLLAKKVDAITAGTRKLLVSEGLEKQSTMDAWESAYKNYIPMFRDEAESGVPHPQGSGFNVSGSASKRAMGSEKEVTNILAHVLMQREAAITRAEKNRVALSLYGLALSHPNKGFWSPIKPAMSKETIASELEAMGIKEAQFDNAPTLRVIDKATGFVRTVPNPSYKQLPGAITLKLNGEDRVLMLNVDNERGARLAESLKNLDGLTKLDIAGSIVGKTTRWMAAVNTQYNPVFGFVNVVRDVWGASVNLGSTELNGSALKVLANTPAALKGIAANLMGKTGGKWLELYDQFQADGGQTGYKEMFRDANERNEAIEKQLKGLQREGKLTPSRAAHAVLDALAGFNTTLENGVRLSAYSAALDQGMSRPAAAKLARELTVDFNRKGRLGRELGPLYAFFNASIQGTARTLETLNGKTGTQVILGGLMLGAAQSLMLAAAGFDDDEIEEYAKTRSLIIPTGDKKYISIPYPLGLHVLPNTGRVIAELVNSGGKNVGSKTAAAVGELAGAFSPFGGGNILTADGALRTIAPTVIDPFVELGFNKNFAGRPIEKQGYGDEKDSRPGYQKAKESTQRSATGQAYLSISKLINDATMGSDYEAGVLSPTPERIRYIAQTAGGGVLRELEKIINLSVKNDDVKSTELPLVGRFTGEVDDDRVQQSRYFKSAKEIDRAQMSMNAAKKKGDGAAMEKVIEQHPEIVLAQAQDKVQRDLSKLNKLAVSVIDDPAQIKEVDKARVETMRGLNEAIRELERGKK